MGNIPEHRKSIVSSETSVKHGRTKQSASRVGRNGSTFMSLDAARSVVNPVLGIAAALIRRGHMRVVDGWANRLGRFFIRLERGSYADHRSRFWPDLTYEGVAKRCVSIFKQVINGRGSSTLPPDVRVELEKVEIHQSDKIGARGVFPPFSEWGNAKVAEIWRDKPPLPGLNRPALLKALEDLAAWKPAKRMTVNINSWRVGLEHADERDVDPRSLDTTTNSGFPSWVSGWWHRVWSKAVTIYQKAAQIQVESDAKDLWEALYHADSVDEAKRLVHYVSVANQRTNVASGYKATKDNTYHGIIHSKLRVVNAMPKTDTLCGKPYANWLIDHCSKVIVNPDGTHPFIALTTPERIAKNMQVCLDSCEREGIIPLGADFSGYDSTIAPWLAWAVAQAVARSWMDETAGRIFLALVWGAFYQTSCLTPTKYFGEGPSSMKSGSWLTNIMDSLINYVVQRYFLHAGFASKIVSQFVQGDDAVFAFIPTQEAVEKFGTVPSIFEHVVSDLGLEGNADKQFYAKDMISFCQLTHVRGYPGGIYPISRASASIVSTEDDVQYGAMTYDQFKYVATYRTLCRANNACFNPAFTQWLMFLKDGDTELHLCADIPASKLAKIVGADELEKLQRLWVNKPWQSQGTGGFDRFPVNRVLRGETIPALGVDRFEWVYGVKYSKVPL